MTPRVLVIDDEVAIRTAFAMALEEAGCAVQAVGSAEEALERLQPGAFDLLLVDLDLPGMSGVELIRRVRAQDEAVHCIVVTGRPTAATAVEGLNLGIDDYVEKPVQHVDQLVWRVQTALKKRRGRPASSGLARAWRALAGRGASGPMRVVVASASDGTRAGVTAALEPIDASLSLVGSAAEVLAQVDEAPPDLVFLDGALEQDVSDLVADVLARAPRAACVVVSADLPLPVIERLPRVGAKGCITHPPGSPGFAEQLAAILDLVREERGPQRVK
jgi:DNA-binding response OmpR family regulator